MLQNGETIEMRKASREMDAAFALEVLNKAPYVTVSMTRPDGTPYGLPLSLARIDENTFYFHCALEGDKLDCIAHCPTVFLSAVTKCAPTVGPKDGSFTLQYKSAMAVADLYCNVKLPSLGPTVGAHLVTAERNTVGQCDMQSNLSPSEAQWK